MTEEEWKASRDLYDLLTQLPEPWDERKLWLFGCACLRRQWHLLGDIKTQRCVELAEASVDGLCTGEELNAAWRSFETAALEGTLSGTTHFDSHEAIYNLLGFVDPACSLQVAEIVADSICENADCHEQERRDQANLLHDIFGNPFRPVVADPSWLTPTAVSIATAIYQDRAFDRLPILADALEEAGCSNADLLLHCRQPGEHVRGCWVVDLLLRKQ